MKLVIRSVGTFTHANLRSWVPDDPENICDIIIIGIGEAGKNKGQDVFTLRVATPKGLSRLPPTKNSIITFRPLVISRFDYDDLWEWINLTVKECEDDGWMGCVQNLRRFFDWEFDGYTE